MTHPALNSGRVAVVTGAASGIGLAACRRFAGLGMRVCLVDLEEEALEAAEAELRAAEGDAELLAIAADVAERGQVEGVAATVHDRFGEVGLVMNNAVTRLGRGQPWGQCADWRRAVEVNLWGVVNGVEAFLPRMLRQAEPGLIVNLGSKQGITNPPGNAVYNFCKAAVKSYTESLQHDLRNREDCPVTAHLLIPGFTTTGGRAHQPGAWLPGQVVDYMVEGLARGDFYILCPDNEVTAAMDRKRILWGAGDVALNRPPLSRWHADFARAFEDFEA